MSERIVDCNGDEVVVGATVLWGDDPGDVCVVVKITEADADYDDDLGRGVLYPPKVTVRFPDGTVDGTTCYDVTQHSLANSYPDGPDVWVYQCDDIQVVP